MTLFSNSWVPHDLLSPDLVSLRPQFSTMINYGAVTRLPRTITVKVSTARTAILRTRLVFYCFIVNRGPLVVSEVSKHVQEGARWER